MIYFKHFKVSDFSTRLIGLLLAVQLFVLPVSHSQENVQASNPLALSHYPLDNNLQDENENHHAIAIGEEPSFTSEAERNYAAFGSDNALKLPKVLSENILADGSLKVDFDFRFHDTDAKTMLFSATETENFWFSGGMKLMIQDSYLIFFYNDGHEAEENFAWEELTTIEANRWYNVSIVFAPKENIWRITLNDQVFSKSIESRHDVSKISSGIENSIFTFSGSNGEKFDSHQGRLDIDELTIYSPIPALNNEVNSAFTQLANHINNTAILSNEALESEYAILEEHLIFTDFNAISTSLFAFTQAYEDNFEPLYSDKKEYTYQALPTLGRTLQLAQSFVMSSQFVEGNIDNVAGIKFEHAEIAPGIVKEGTERVTSANVELLGSYQTNVAAEMSQQDMVVRPTGYYVAAGDIVTISVPPEVADKGLSVIVGVHFRNMDYDYIGTMNRFPDISIEYTLNNSEIKIANPLGGGIYLKVPDGVDAGWFNMVIDNAVKSPYFSYRAGRETDVENWLIQVAETGAPWADFESDKFMFTVPTYLLDGVTNPNEIMAKWDEIHDSYRVFTGHPLERERAEFYTFDTRLVTPAFGNGYPIVISFEALDSDLVNNKGWNPLTVLETRPNTTLQHEMGHNHLMPTLNYGPDYGACHYLESETNVHMLAMASNAQAYGLSLEDAFQYSFIGDITFSEAAFDWIITSNFRNNLPMIYDESAPVDDKNMLHYQFRGWAKYGDIARLFGWQDGIGKVNGMFYTEGEKRVGKACEETPMSIGRDEYIEAASKALNVNMAPLFHFWGIIPSDELASELAVTYPKSEAIYELIKNYREQVAPLSFEDYQSFHDQIYPKSGYQQPRYDFYLTDFSDTYVEEIQAQFDLLIEKYGLDKVNTAPTISIDEHQAIFEEGSSIALSVSISDPDVQTHSILWEQVSGPEITFSDTESQSINFTSPDVSSDQTIEIKVTVSDGIEEVSTTTNFTITHIQNTTPSIGIDEHQASYQEGSTISLTVSVSDQDNQTHSILWEQVSGPTVSLSNSESQTISFTAPNVSSDQTIEIKVTVSDGIDEVTANTNFSVTNTQTATPPASNNDSGGGGGGGSFNFFMLMLLMMFSINRRTLQKSTPIS